MKQTTLSDTEAAILLQRWWRRILVHFLCYFNIRIIIRMWCDRCIFHISKHHDSAESDTHVALITN